jgi:hypothetical protein
MNRMAGWLVGTIKKCTEWFTVDLEGGDASACFSLLQCSVCGLSPIAIPPVRWIVVVRFEVLTAVSVVILSYRMRHSIVTYSFVKFWRKFSKFLSNYMPSHPRRWYFLH